MAEFKGYFKDKDANFTKDSMMKLGALRAKLAIDYGGFFRKMMKIYSPKGPQYKELEAGLKLSTASIYYIDTLMGKRDRPATVEEFKILSQRLDELAAQMEYFVRLYAKSKKFKKEVDRLEVETGVSLEHIAGVSGELGGEVAKAAVGTQGKMGFLQQHAPGVGDVAGRLGKGFMTAALGPFTPLAEMALGTFRGIRKGMRSRKTASQSAGWMSRFGPGGIDTSDMDIRGAFGQRAGGHGLGGVFDDPLMNFYNKGAYNAKYTKEMLNSLKKISGDKPGKSLMSGIMGGLGQAIAPFVGPILGVLAAILTAILAYKAGGAINTALGNKVDKTFGKGAYDDFWLTFFSGGKLGKSKTGRLAAMATPLTQLTGMAFPDGTAGMTPEMYKIRKEKGETDEEMGVSPQAAQIFALKNFGNKIKSGITGLFKGKEEGGGQTVVPNSITSSRHRDSDPLTDKLNRTDED